MRVSILLYWIGAWEEVIEQRVMTALFGVSILLYWIGAWEVVDQPDIVA